MINALRQDFAPDKTWVYDWLSIPRFRTYLDASGNNMSRALRLYEWNIDLGQVLMKDIAFFEVALRNAYDRAISSHWEGSESWLFDGSSPVNIPILRRSSSGKMFDANALNRASIHSAASSYKELSQPGKIIANLSFGFWAHLTDKAHERALWIPYLHHAWPVGTNRADLNAKIKLINECRNRIAHHEPLFHYVRQAASPTAIDRSVISLFHQLLPLADVFDPNAPTTSVETFLQSNPRP
ncbi:Abi family protein [Bifidobacterium oedipodis]|uniref:Abi-like protein n=1 Tax=Bifidobacterium oedipodis TaxID=2675322 RepID=A0A7Y0EMF7_9BIFI|nr:Abi family protein [Bifidobacterium sp. DSM 109957]NMM92931.1 Abi-like protein [Bifidobacterium sp. DSM 109957]